MRVYGVFETASDYEFYFEDILLKDVDGNFLIFSTLDGALVSKPDDKLDNNDHGSTYEVKVIDIEQWKVDFMTDINVSEKTGVDYDDMELLVVLFNKTTNGEDFIEAAKRTVRQLSVKELWLVWWAIKARDNQ